MSEFIPWLTGACIVLVLVLVLPAIMYSVFRAMSYGWHRGKREANRDILRNGRHEPLREVEDA